MSRRITLNTFRKVARAEERLIRATMPRTSAGDPEALTPYTNVPSTASKTLMFKLREVAHV